MRRCVDVCFLHAHEKKITVDILRIDTLFYFNDDWETRYVLILIEKEMLASVSTLPRLNVSLP